MSETTGQTTDQAVYRHSVRCVYRAHLLDARSTKAWCALRGEWVDVSACGAQCPQFWPRGVQRAEPSEESEESEADHS